MIGVVLPVGVTVADIGSISAMDVRVAVGVTVAVVEVVVDDNIVATPAAAPAPSAGPATSAPERSHRHTHAEADRRSGSHRAPPVCRVYDGWVRVHRRP